MIIASRLSGTRPLGVFFEIDRPARHIVWKVNNSDSFVGQIMAYVFTDVGSHTVRAIITDDSGVVVEEVVIDVKFHAGPFLYVANNGDNKAGGDKNHPLKTISAALDMARSRTRIYVRKGDVFDIPNWSRVRESGIYIRPYGQGVKPILRGGFLYCVADDIRVQGMRFEGAEHGVLFAQNTADNLIYNCEITNASIAVKLNDSGASGITVAKNIIVKGCDIHHVQHYGVYGKTNGFAFLDSQVREYNTGHHGIRIASGQRVVVNRSYITSSTIPFSYTSLTIRGGGDGTSFTKATVSENIFDRMATCGPQNDTFDEDVSDVEWYANVFNHSPLSHSSIGISCVAKNVKIIENVFLYCSAAIEFRGKHVSKLADNILVQGNRHLANQRLNDSQSFITGKGGNIKCLDNLHESHTFAKWSKVVGFNGALENARNSYIVVRGANFPLFRVNGIDSSTLPGWTEFGEGDINTTPGWLFNIPVPIDPYSP